MPFWVRLNWTLPYEGRMASGSSIKQWKNSVSVKPQNVDMLDIYFSETFILSGGGFFSLTLKCTV